MPLSAATIYDNSTTDLSTRFDPGTSQVGNEILLAGTDRYLTGFSFEYWELNTSGSQVQADVQFYLNNGTLFNGYAMPGSTSFFDSGWFNVSATDRSTENLSVADFPSDLPLFLPLANGESNMTWTVQFRGMQTGLDSAGVDLYGPPTVGSAYGDYWQKTGLNTWALMNNSAFPSLASDFAAVMTVPEPSSMALSVLGGMGLLIMVRRFRRKE
jgi:hypothetical protein